MFIKTLYHACAASVIAASLGGAAQAAVLSAGDFTGWETRLYTENSAGADFSFPTTGGNPDDYVFIENFSQAGIGTGSFVISGVLMPDLVTTDTGTWASSFSVDVNTNFGSGSVQAFGILVEQEKRLYWRQFGTTAATSGWQTYNQGAFSITGTDFSQLTGTTTALDLSAPFLAGLATGNSRSGHQDVAYDNFAVEGVTLAAVPLPASAVLVLGGLGGLGALRARRRKN